MAWGICCDIGGKVQKMRSPREDCFVSGAAHGLASLVRSRDVLWVKFLSRVDSERGEQTTILIMTGPMDGRGGTGPSFKSMAGMGHLRNKELFHFVRQHDEKASWAVRERDAWILIDDDERCLEEEVEHRIDASWGDGFKASAMRKTHRGLDH